MFCNNCGKKIKPGALKCSCGAPVEKMEYCGGFWGLVGKNPKSSSSAPHPDTLSRNEIAERGYKPSPENAEINSSREISGNYDYTGEREERRSRSSKAGIGLIAGIALAAIVLVGGGAFFLFRGGDDDKTQKNLGKSVVEETSTKLNVEESTENAQSIQSSQDGETVTIDQLNYAKDNYVIPMFEKMEKQEEKISVTFYKKADVKDPNEENETLKEAWTDFSRQTKEVRKDFDRLKEDFAKIYQGDSEKDQDFANFLDSREKSLLKAEMDIEVHDKFSCIGKTGSGYVSKDDSDVVNDDGWLSDPYVKYAEKIFSNYRKLEESCINKDAGFASWVYLSRLEVIFSDYNIASCKETLMEVSERESLEEMDGQDYQNAAKKDGDFDGKLELIDFCLKDLDDSPAKSHLKNLDDYKIIKKLSDKESSDAGQSSQSTAVEKDDSSAPPAVTEEPANEDLLNPEHRR